MEDKVDKRSWTRDETFSLIAQFESYPELWDVKNKDYKNRVKKHKAIKNLSVVFKTTRNEINRKLHNLRTQFHQELRKMRRRKCGSSAGNVYESSWQFFGPMHFISTNQFDEKTSNNIVKNEVDYSNKMDEVNQEENGVEEFEEIENFEMPKENEIERLEMPEKTVPATRKKRAESNDYVLMEMAMKLMEKPTDDFQVFGNFVAAEIRNLRSMQLQNKLKRIIQRAILEISELDEEPALS